MYVDTCKTNGGRSVRHLLRTSYREEGRVKHKTIANLSQCSDEEIAAIRLALKHKDQLAALADGSGDVELKQGTRFGDIYTIMKKAQELGIVQALGDSTEAKLALWQVIARVVEQGSRLSAVRLAANSAAVDILDLPSFCEDDLYKNLAWLAAEQSRIEQSLLAFRRLPADGDDYYLYDVTSCYLEGTQNHFAAFGYNRDKKKGKMQIVIGLLCDNEGVPVAIEVFAGNTRDTATVSSQLRKLAERFAAASIVLVGDRGMLKGPQINELHSDEFNFNYITAISKPEIHTLLRRGLLQMELFDSDLAEVVDGQIRYILRCNPMRRDEIRATRTSKLNAVRALLQEQNEYLHGHSRAQAEVAKRKVAEKIEKLKLQGFVAVAGTADKPRELLLEIDEDARAEAEKLDGCYVIKTDVQAARAEKEQVHQRYKDLAEVEWAFRTAKKSFLETQPVYVRCEESTRGHVLVVMLAYMLVQTLSRDWAQFDLPVEEGLASLPTLCPMHMPVGPTATCNQPPQPNAPNRRLWDGTPVPAPATLPPPTPRVTPADQ
ncbi:IS1634 family transposase, partial [Thiohalocapsa sp.]|uniref:IS1634 family transposase n=1 Tax=Thiohalocapsa sp. TaxID=2497641 RepID=UPI0025F3B2BA